MHVLKWHKAFATLNGFCHWMNSKTSKNILIVQLHTYTVVYESKVSKKSKISVNENNQDKNCLGKLFSRENFAH